MRILINAEADRLELFSRITGERFLPLKNPGKGDDAVAVAVCGNTFKSDLEAAAVTGVPVVIIAGKAGAECAGEAERWGIPESCIVIKQDDRVISLDGREIARAVGRGIGVRAVLEAARYALENNLYPEPLVWEEEAEPLIYEEPPVREEPPDREPERREPEQKSKEKKNNVVKLARGENLNAQMEGIMNMAEEIAVVFKATNDAESGKAAKELAERLRGVHLEISTSPSSYLLYGDSIEKAVETGRYMCSNCATFTGPGYTGSRWLVVEMDSSAMSVLPELVNKIYERASKVIHTVGALKEGQMAVKTWVESGWKLDAVVPNRSAFEGFKKHFGRLVIPDVAALQLA